jgi:DNA-binding response OmpR family regulator
MPLLRPKTLVIEDDAAIRRGVIDALRAAGHQPTEAARGDDGLRIAMQGDFDLVLLDLVLPGGSGWEILRAIRAARPDLPVIVLTACGAEDDRVSGLQLGADDYVVKPFSLRELLARVDAVLRRATASPQSGTMLQFDGGAIDTTTGRVEFENGQSTELSEKEVEIIRYLARRAGRAVSRDELLLRVWRIDPRGVQTRTVDMHITRLREKLNDDPAAPRVLRTVWGQGYCFLAPGANS